MATVLTKPVRRVVRRLGGRDLTVTLIPPLDQLPALISIKEHGARTSRVIGIGSLFVMLARLEAENARIAKRGARAPRGRL